MEKASQAISGGSAHNRDCLHGIISVDADMGIRHTVGHRSRSISSLRGWFLNAAMLRPTSQISLRNNLHPLRQIQIQIQIDHHQWADHGLYCER
jgi:hypothetical protein